MARLLKRASSVPALRKLQQDELEAWDEYREACRLSGDRYDAVEAWAWNRLQSRLTANTARRTAVRASDA